MPLQARANTRMQEPASLFWVIDAAFNVFFTMTD